LWIEKPVKDIEKEKTLSLKHGADTTTNPLIISQKERKRRNSLLENQGITEEDLEDLSAAGIDPASWKDYTE
jgi:hypothetical protein